MPFIKNEFGLLSQDAIIPVAGLEYANFEFGYNFDLNLSRLDPVAGGGAHQFSLIYNFRMPKDSYKTPSNKKKLGCPTFVHRLNN